MEIDKGGALPRNSDRIKTIRLRARGEETVIDSGTEGEKLTSMVDILKEADPDILFTEGGDSFLFPYLAVRARENGIGEQLILGRDDSKLELPSRPGTSYFQYGRVHYKSSGVTLRGRVHVDISNSFAASEVGLYGLYELSRTCRMPLHTSSRASIGRALSSLQLYHAHKKGLLVPWKPTMAESFKSRLELLVADRGGFIFEPRVGLYEGVAEFDYACLVKDSRVITRQGEKPVSEMKEGEEVFTPFGWQRTLCVHRYPLKGKVVKLTLTDGKTLDMHHATQIPHTR